MSETKKDYERLIEINTEIKACISNLEKTIAANTLSQEKESDRYFKIILALIAMVGGILGLKLNFPQNSTMIGMAMRNVALHVDWASTLSNFGRYYTVFALIFTGGSILREYWNNGYNKYLGFGMIIMSVSIILQIFDIFGTLDREAFVFRLLYNTLFLLYAYNLGFRTKKPMKQIFEELKS